MTRQQINEIESAARDCAHWAAVVDNDLALDGYCDAAIKLKTIRKQHHENFLTAARCLRNALRKLPREKS